MVALFVASHYKNAPNDLQLMSDAPAHRLFALLGPADKNSTKLPDVIACVQVSDGTAASSPGFPHPPFPPLLARVALFFYTARVQAPQPPFDGLCHEPCPGSSARSMRPCASVRWPTPVTLDTGRWMSRKACSHNLLLLPLGPLALAPSFRVSLDATQPLTTATLSRAPPPRSARFASRARSRKSLSTARWRAAGRPRAT